LENFKDDENKYFGILSFKNLLPKMPFPRKLYVVFWNEEREDVER